MKSPILAGLIVFSIVISTKAVSQSTNTESAAAMKERWFQTGKDAAQSSPPPIGAHSTPSSLIPT